MDIELRRLQRLAAQGDSQAAIRALQIQENLDGKSQAIQDWLTGMLRRFSFPPDRKHPFCFDNADGEFSISGLFFHITVNPAKSTMAYVYGDMASPRGDRRRIYVVGVLDKENQTFSYGVLNYYHFHRIHPRLFSHPQATIATIDKVWIEWARRPSKSKTKLTVPLEIARRFAILSEFKSGDWFPEIWFHHLSP